MMQHEVANNKQSQKKYWFPAKKYGYGWGLPVTWQGWVVVVSYLVLITAAVFLFPVYTEAGLLQHALFTVFLTIVLIGVCWFKGEPAKWRWGGENH